MKLGADLYEMVLYCMGIVQCTPMSFKGLNPKKRAC